jgi:hypothetical protein
MHVITVTAQHATRCPPIVVHALVEALQLSWTPLIEVLEPAQQKAWQGCCLHAGDSVVHTVAHNHARQHALGVCLSAVMINVVISMSIYRVMAVWLQSAASATCINGALMWTEQSRTRRAHRSITQLVTASPSRKQASGLGSRFLHATKALLTPLHSDDMSFDADMSTEDAGIGGGSSCVPIASQKRPNQALRAS